MKKLLLVAIALTTSLGLVACGNEANSTKKPKQDVKTEQHKTKTNKADSEKTTPKKDNEKNSDSNNTAVASNEDKTTNSTAQQQDSSNTESASTPSQASQPAQSSPTTQPTRSQKYETNGMGDVVTSPSQAITTLSNGLGNNSDFAYTLLSTANHMYEIQVTSKSIRAQGGSGTIGIYDVMEDGTYFLRP
ncbi:hypothetical protein [Fructilactobacillus frigidiflavus]|uniref:hypothetical protein n=1 Tax=Fructilactobacillus frigidiflavus TaxID=3242688 RepID=UPI0037579709